MCSLVCVLGRATLKVAARTISGDIARGLEAKAGGLNLAGKGAQTYCIPKMEPQLTISKHARTLEHTSSSALQEGHMLKIDVEDTSTVSSCKLLLNQHSCSVPPGNLVVQVHGHKVDHSLCQVYT